MASAKLDKLLEEHTAEGESTKDKLNGAAFIVVDKDGIIYEGSSGRLSPDPDSAKFDKDSVTLIASMTKFVTAICVMQIVEKGLVKLDDDVGPLVPEVAKMQYLAGFDDDGQPILEKPKTPITLRILLTHSTGLPYDAGDFGGQQLGEPEIIRWKTAIGRTASTLSGTREGFATPLLCQPGEGWYYGSSIDWAGLTLEAVTGKTLFEYMKENVLRPLGRSDTVFRIAELGDAAKPRQVPCSFRDPGSGELATMEPWFLPPNGEFDSGGGGLWSSTADYAAIVAAVLADLEDGRHRLLARETVQEMIRPQLTNPKAIDMLTNLKGLIRDGLFEYPIGFPLNHGLSGVIPTQDIPGKRRAGTLSWYGALNSHWWIDPKTKIAGVMVTNLMPMGDKVAWSLFDQLEQTVYGELVPELQK